MDQRFRQAIDKGKGLALALAVVTDLLLVSSVIGEMVPDLAGVFPAWPASIAAVVHAFCAWCWLMAVLGYARKYLSSPKPVLAYAGEAVLPFYMLHQTVIVIIAFFIRDWTLAVGLKYLLVVCVTFTVVMGLYEFAIRRNRVLRFLFGMPAARPGAGS